MLRCLSVFILVLTFVPVLLADSPATVCSFVEYSADRTFVFAMLAPGSENECLSQGPERLAEAKEIRSKYPVSGMYQVGDPAMLAWPIEEQWFSFKVHVLNDGKNLIRMGPWARDLRDEAFSACSRGEDSPDSPDQRTDPVRIFGRTHSLALFLDERCEPRSKFCPV